MSSHDEPLVARQIDAAFRQFRLGTACFFCGFVALFAAYHLLQPSLIQEIAVALALAVMLMGFTVALLGEGRMLLLRLWSFFQSK